jgi:enterochelin esterase family protein
MAVTLQGRIVLDDFDCEALRGNPLGDPSRRSTPVYLPPGYDRGDQRYPVIYWLHGWGGTGLRELNTSPWIPSLPELVDRVIAEGAPPAILVMADLFTAFGHSQGVNSTATGRYEDAMRELVGHIDRRYRTRPGPAHRGLDGKSSGGYAALVLGMRNPDLFGAVASHSGDMYFEACYRVDFWRAVDTIRKHGGLAGYLRAWREATKKTEELVRPMVTVVCMAMAYSPNAAAPHGFDLPVDLETGELDQAVWARWLSWDPVVMAVERADALRAMRLVYVECGSRDQYNLHHGARVLHRRLERLGVRHEYQEFDDDHTAVNYRYVESFRRLCAALQG